MIQKLKQYQLLLVGVFAFVFLFAGCKYELGPIISFVSEETRIGRGWKFSKVYHNKVLVTNGSADSVVYTTSLLGFDTKGRFSFLVSDLRVGHKGNTLYNGNWAFDNDKKDLVLKYDNDGRPTKTYRIFKLTEADLNLRLDEAGDVTEYYLVQTK